MSSVNTLSSAVRSRPLIAATSASTVARFFASLIRASSLCQQGCCVRRNVEVAPRGLEEGVQRVAHDVEALRPWSTQQAAMQDAGAPLGRDAAALVEAAPQRGGVLLQGAQGRHDGADAVRWERQQD